jgi:hypothetical protein
VSQIKNRLNYYKEFQIYDFYYNYIINESRAEPIQLVQLFFVTEKAPPKG